MQPQPPIPLTDILAARQRLAGLAVRTPLVRLELEDAPAEIFLKLENLQPTGTFKLRGAANALYALDRAALATGVWTASAGNMALALAWCARRLGVPCTAVVPEDAPLVKLAALQRLGARLIPLPFADYQAVQRTHHCPVTAGRLVHPFGDPAVMAGNGIIGLEIVEDLPDVDAVLVPYGGGGLSCGIACAVNAVRPQARVYACEVETAAPLSASLAAGRPVEVPYTPSFISGMGAPFVFPEMWPLASRCLAGALVVSLVQVARAVQLLATHNHVIAEGAGAVAAAAALAGLAPAGKLVCVVSGGNIDPEKLLIILRGEVP